MRKGFSRVPKGRRHKRPLPNQIFAACKETKIVKVFRPPVKLGYRMRRILGFAVALVLLAFGLSAATTATKKRARKSAATKTSPAARKRTAPSKTATASKTNTTLRKRTPASKRSSGRKTVVRRGARKSAATRTTWRNRQTVPTPERYREIQGALAAKGYLKPEDADGSWNQSSVDALRKFQADQNLEATGKINSLSLIALGLGPKHETAAASKPPSQP
jgi:hypothetical protein